MNDIMRPSKKIKVTIHINDEEEFVDEWFQDSDSGVETQTIHGKTPSRSIAGVALAALHKVICYHFSEVKPAYHCERNEVRMPVNLKSKRQIDSSKRTVLVPIAGSLWDIEYSCRVGTNIQFFVRPDGENFAYLDRKKSWVDTCLRQSSMLGHPRKFDARSVAVFVSDNLRDIAKYAYISFKFQDKTFTRPLSDFTWCNFKSAVERLRKTKIEEERTGLLPDNELPSWETLPLNDFSTIIEPGQAFSATFQWDSRTPIEYVGEKFDAAVALCGFHYSPLCTYENI